MSSVRRSPWLLLLAALVLPGGSAAAQAARIDPQAAAEALARLSGDATIRVESRDGRRIEGRFGGLSQSALRVSFDGGGESVALDSLSAAWIRGRHTGTGAVLGGVAGLGFAVFIGVIANNVCESDDCRGAGPYLVGSAIFVPVGALVGAAAGAAIPKWKRILP